MARSLLAPTAFVTLLGLAPGCFPAAASPEETANAGTTATDVPAAEPAAVTPAGLVAYATTRSGNARAPSYDDAMMQTKASDEPYNFVELEEAGPQEVAPQAVVLGFEPEAAVTPTAAPADEP